MATRKRSIKRRHNKTKTKTRKQKGGSIECRYDRPSKKLHITISKDMLEGNLSDIRSVCQKAIDESSPKRVVERPRDKKAHKTAPEKAPKKAVATSSVLKRWPSREDLYSDKGIYEGRRSQDSEDN
jgi:hypothetical protein